MLCVTETKLDHSDVISVPGYCFLSQHRKQKFIRKSGGIGVFYSETLSTKIKAIETESDYILWLRLDRSLFDKNEDLILGILYVPPTQSRFLNDNEYFNLETEITSMCGRSSYICLTGDMNARTASLCDFITTDSFIADLMDFDEDTLSFYNQAEQLNSLNINKNRVSCDKKTNNNGYKLIEICINNNLFILNGRFGNDSTEGRLTFRDQSLIDYTICSFNCLKLLIDFEVIDTDFLLSDGHALLSWSVSTIYHNDQTSTENVVKSHKQWDERLANVFNCNIPLSTIEDLYTNLKPTDSSINEITSQLANVLTNAAKLSFPITNPRNTKQRMPKSFFGPKCNAARKQYHIARKTYKRFRNKRNHTFLLQSSRQYKRTLNFYINKQKHSNAQRLREIHSKQPKTYWRYLNSLKTTDSVNVPPVEDFYNFFKEVNSSRYEESFDFEESGFNGEDADDILNVAISEQEICTAIRNLKSGKSAGLDGILNEYIKCTQNILMPLYSKLFNIIFETGTLPDTWLEGRIRPIFKNKGDKSKPENYRPITVLSCLSKLFTSILNNRLTHFLDLYDTLNENQVLPTLSERLLNY